MLCDKVKDLRESRKMTQQELANALDISQSTIGMIEGNKRPAGRKTLMKLADYFGVSIDYLMEVTPFKNETEAYHSIAVASVLYIHENPEEIPSYIRICLPNEFFEKDIYSDIIDYSRNLLTKYKNNLPLTDLEIFEISNILFLEIKWNSDYDGVVSFTDYDGETFAIKMDFNNIKKLTLDISKSILQKKNFQNDIEYIKHKSALLDNKIINTADNTNYVEPTKQLSLDTIPTEFTNPALARAYVDKHQIFGAHGFDPDRLDDDEILEFANELLRQMEMVSFKYKK